MMACNIVKSNIISVSWGDHLAFGNRESKLDEPGQLEERIKCWKKEFNVGYVLWREQRSALSGHFYSAHGYKKLALQNDIAWDDFEVVPRLCHEMGLKAYLYVTLFDEGWPLPPKKVREVSYHNSMHMQHVSRQSRFSRENPEYTMINRTGDVRQWGVLCFGYPEVRKHFRERYVELLKDYDFDGLFICLRSQSKPADFADQFGFNVPIQRDYQQRYGKNIVKEDFELQEWRDLLGEYLTLFLSELRDALQGYHIKLAVGVPNGDVIGPPLGNWTLQWKEWVEKSIIDDLIINQNSSSCPSLGHDLWPMHRGYGYQQNYVDNKNLYELKDLLNNSYGPVISKHKTKLFVARQWSNRNLRKEKELLANPLVSGLVFSSFRFDNSQVNKHYS